MKITIEHEVTTYEAFKMFLQTLSMEFVLDEDTNYTVGKAADGELWVYTSVNGNLKVFDERGELFVALRNTAVNICPNLSFRSDEYIA